MLEVFSGGNIISVCAGEKTGGAETEDLLVSGSPQAEGGPGETDGPGLGPGQWEHLAQISSTAAHRSHWGLVGLVLHLTINQGHIYNLQPSNTIQYPA